MRAALRAKASCDLVAAVSRLVVPRYVAGHLNSRRGENHVNRAIGCQMLAIAAPANARRPRFGCDAVTYLAAQAAAGSGVHLQAPQGVGASAHGFAIRTLHLCHAHFVMRVPSAYAHGLRGQVLGVGLPGGNGFGAGPV